MTSTTLGQPTFTQTAFTRQVKAMSDRLTTLYQEIHPSSALSPSMLKELGVACERLEVAAELLHEQNHKLLYAEQTITGERQRYQALLDFIPDACLITDSSGRIQEVNQAAGRLLNLEPERLVGQLLTAFITSDTKQSFQALLQQLPQRSWKQEWQARIQPHQGIAFGVSALVEANSSGETPVLRWLLRRANHANWNEAQEQTDVYADLGYPLQLYHKGEVIPLDPEIIWQVHSGLVKLTTFTQNGQEVLVGLAGALAPFGSSLTTLPLYEATAMMTTQVWGIRVSDFANSPELKQRLMPQISQRLKQTESLLAVSGHSRVVDRLHSLLHLLEQEVGQPVAGGTRLRVRLTHEHLATACCTTRVTITRLLKQLQQQKKLSVDSRHHLILRK
ncbi:PAS domain-containing protein [Phormidium tenue FACHB-886]|nr:PAS domain-containing protein [Phormidium tenue FACHB-886]